MKDLVQFITESWDDTKVPKIGATVYDYNGEPWKIEQYAVVKNADNNYPDIEEDDGSSDNDDDISELEDLIGVYDDSGCMQEMLDDGGVGEGQYIIGCIGLGKNQRVRAAWVYGPDGACEDNKGNKPEE